MKCPCCKVINSLDEALKHHSITSVQSALRAWQSYVAMKPEEMILAIFPCPTHGSEGGYYKFIDDANEKKQALVDRARVEQERLMAENIDRMIRQAAMRLVLGR